MKSAVEPSIYFGKTTRMKAEQNAPDALPGEMTAMTMLSRRLTWGDNGHDDALQHFHDGVQPQL